MNLTEVPALITIRFANEISHRDRIIFGRAAVQRPDDKL
jgi:hypothetical protein